MSKLELQQSCFESIKTLCNNYKKDGSSRRTLDYIKKKLSSLESQWIDFDCRHKELIVDIEEKNVSYFNDDVYDKTKELYMSTKADMELWQLKLTQQAKTVKFDLAGILDKNSEDEETVTLLRKQECNFKAIDRALSKIDIQDVMEKWELEDHLNILKTKWDSIDRLHWELEAKLKGTTNQQYNDMFTNIENKYDNMKRALSSKIWSTVHFEKSTPKIEIPVFSGNYSEWISFKDLFYETIHNNPSISKAQKMQHLKTKLKGEALRLVQHLSISADNYDSCWVILNHRFEDRRHQFDSFMNTMLNLPVIQHPDAFNLKRLHDVITECLNGLTNIGLDITTWDPMIVHLMSQKLDPDNYNEYIKELKRQDVRDLPRLSDFLSFVESRFIQYEKMKKPSSSQKQQLTTKTNNNQAPEKKNFFEAKKSFSKSYHTVHSKCPYCEGSHVLMQCAKFTNMDATQRKNTVVKLNLCKNCLFSHGGEECKSIKTCKECNLRHHTLLHYPTNINSGNNSGPKPSSAQSSNHVTTNEMEVLLPTVQVHVKSSDGTYTKLRALLDQGSQVNLITENAAQLLKLPRKRMNATISGVGSVTGDCKGRLQLSCKSIHNNCTFETEVLIMRKLTNNLPNSSFEKANWPNLENLKLADPDFNISRPIDLLLGADIYSEILLDGLLRGNQRAPIAQQTQLGWILCGKLETFNCHATVINFDEITKFWENEDITQNTNDLPINDQCEEHYQKTVERATDGKFIVKMPLCSDFQSKLGNSRSIAVSQFLQLEKRLEKNNKLCRMYREFIREYSDLGHMKPAAPITSQPECYLPHHGVLRESSSTTKLRVVFNASQKTSSGYSLNSLQEKGPNLQKDIQELILKWRSYKYAFTADIEKMYRCIWAAADQQNLQKIIYRSSPNERLQEFQLCTVTYGMKCAPWLAMRTLKQLALEDGHKYPAAAEVLKNEFYMDDLVSGENSLKKAKELQLSLIKLLNGGGMNLRKWSSNHPALLEDLHEDQISNTSLFDFKDEDSMKTLGLGWNPKTDNFVFNWNLEDKPGQPLTKRRLLSEISKLYDPIGWWSPITIAVKLIFQKVWLNELEWDEILPNEIQNEWEKLKNELPEIQNIKLGRWIGGTQPNIQLLGFCDASEKAYACVIYSRVINECGEPVITLVAAKTRVAPIAQKVTLPRLELCGALLLSQMTKKIREALTGYNITTQAWCDSQVVLAWLQGETERWERYVANRVEKIKQVIEAERWNYIKSEDNPADCASRGLSPSKLINFDLWWQGPAFLKNCEEQEATKNTYCHFTTNLETKNKTETTLTEQKQNTNFINELLDKYSSVTRVIRVTAFVMRFIRNVRCKSKSDTEYVTARELNKATELIIKTVQQTTLTEEYKQLSKKQTISKQSKIYKLNPYLDDEGTIRVGGRLSNSNLPVAMKNPAILPRKGRLTSLLIEHAHMVTLHGGARLTLAYLRQRYWIVGGNRATKDQLRHCVQCHRYKSTKNYQLMGDLPQQRATPSRPFTHTGVDFTGHVEVKLNKGRGVKTSKGYIAIFVCMATKAVHIELVSDLSTETFIAALQRMSARRGTPKHMYSDRGTNFIGAAKKLHLEFEEFQRILSTEFFDEIGKMEIEWHFNAPAWPNAGGLWEAAVKSMKYHLHRVLGDQKLTYEEFSTLLTKIEACMNSRPLCPLTEDPEEFYNYLTPGHFLTGSATLTLPLSDYTDVRSIDLRRRWQLTENMLHQFWKTWSNEYLTQLQKRSKWNKPTENIKEGDIVLVKDDNLPPGKWAMGRVLELHPGADGYVRVTTIKTQTGILKRPVVKLSPLPKPENEVEPETEKTNTSTDVELTARAAHAVHAARAPAGAGAAPNSPRAISGRQQYSF